MIKTIVIIAAALALTGCAGYQFRDYRDRAYDPKGEYTLLDQIPNWDTPTYNKYYGKATRDAAR